MPFIDTPVSLQIELSNVCNALCPTCQRNTINWQVLKDMTEPLTIENLPVINVPTVSSAPNIYVLPQTIKRIVQSKVYKQIKRIDFVGTIDDPLASPYLLEILKIFRDANPKITFGMHTNGSLRTPDLFAKLATYFNSSDNSLSFSIDGLQDTNHLYRRNCQWTKIMENATAFINAGGSAKWQYIEFPWNMHQVEQAKQLSKQMGFHQFLHRKNIHTQWKQDIANWNWGDFVDMVELDPVYSIAQIEPTDTITCNYQKRKQYHISYDSKLWPCCILNSSRGNVKTKRHFESNWTNRYNNKNWNCLIDNNIDDIIAHEFYQNDLVDSWSSNTHGPNKKDRIINCTMSCSKSKDNANQDRVIDKVNN